MTKPAIYDFTSEIGLEDMGNPSSIVSPTAWAKHLSLIHILTNVATCGIRLAKADRVTIPVQVGKLMGPQLTFAYLPAPQGLV